jgi:hypothetical protein
VSLFPSRPLVTTILLPVSDCDNCNYLVCVVPWFCVTWSLIHVLRVKSTCGHAAFCVSILSEDACLAPMFSYCEWHCWQHGVHAGPRLCSSFEKPQCYFHNNCSSLTLGGNVPGFVGFLVWGRGWCRSLNSGSTTRVTPPAFFCDELF